MEASRPNAVGHLRGRGDRNNLLFTGHMDTAYGGQEELPQGEGFQPKAAIHDGWLFGLGVNNMKSGLAGALIAIEAIARAEVRLAGDISFGAVVNAIASMHELQADIAAWANDYENRHEFMGEHPNVTLAAIRGGASWGLSRRPQTARPGRSDPAGIAALTWAGRPDRSSRI